ncbi:MAG: peptidoglycan DD-metalloendopeptidase family protein [Gammaproteobacteria bacterium]
MLALLLSACAGKPPVIVERSLTGEGPVSHRVVAGDTLYSIAVRYDKDYRELARLNSLDDTYLIRPGQQLRLVGKPLPVKRQPVRTVPREVATATKRAPEVVQAPKNVTPVAKKQPSVGVTPAVVTAQSSASASLAWGWPVKGSLLSRFGAPGLAGKGLDIAAKRGDSVLAASDGTVVYAGSGLVGYGKLLILRHDENYISAYAHNDRFLVAEGERVKLGQAIAVVGASGTDREKLHFEIREGGKPVDPLRFLPARE